MDQCGLTEHKTDLISFFMARGLLHRLARYPTAVEAERLLGNILAQADEPAPTQILESHSSDEKAPRYVQPRDGDV